jgi:hypothetical protein
VRERNLNRLRFLQRERGIQPRKLISDFYNINLNRTRQSRKFKSQQNVFNVTLKELPEKNPTFVRRLFRDMLQTEMFFNVSFFNLSFHKTTCLLPTGKSFPNGTNNRKTKSLIFKQRDESCRRRDFSEEPGAHIKPLHRAFYGIEFWKFLLFFFCA